MCFHNIVNTITIRKIREERDFKFFKSTPKRNFILFYQNHL